MTLPVNKTGENRFPRAERLKSPRKIRKVFKEGVCVSCNGAKLFFMRNGEDYNRMTCAFSRGAARFGKAGRRGAQSVVRNRARRLGREAYRHLRLRINSGWDLVLLLYADIGGGTAKNGKATGFTKVFSNFSELCGRAGLLNDKRRL